MAYGTLTALLASLYSNNTDDCLSLMLSCGHQIPSLNQLHLYLCEVIWERFQDCNLVLNSHHAVNSLTGSNTFLNCSLQKESGPCTPHQLSKMPEGRQLPSKIIHRRNLYEHTTKASDAQLTLHKMKYSNIKAL